MAPVSGHTRGTPKKARLRQLGLLANAKVSQGCQAVHGKRHQGSYPLPAGPVAPYRATSWVAARNTMESLK